MYAAERHQLLVRRARELGRVEVTQVAAELGVTTETIRRDLTALERQGLLHRVHGGAIATDRLEIEPAVGVREVTHPDEKDRIAKAAVAELGSASTILLDAGTTTARVAALLPDDVDLTVVTNALPIATALAGRNRITVHLIGGRVRGTTLSAVDRWALKTLESVNCDVAVLGTNGFSIDRGLTTPDVAESAVKGAIVKAAARSIVVADASKYGTDSFSRFATLADVDTLVTDGALLETHPEAADAIRGAGTDLVIA
ncbi:DeoR/GlpR family DNA-binding transcription regulator [Actinomycetospora sp. NBRC 106378]|uniref:DeoR/GlpR family DNA-binding transcription regulator n=1 Tax=Actinomycetospora sp. NBRC 106378 TaxID=3032208 RepID=UPI0024A2832E|nr:DeoR/GlpR family DNA-binding transcription regulator [Actinomycetospora sp. NBRC 106378]GLZ50749.1 DeoR family transcriptional regulator [Actinomycetospora sp. NBRC 106378]